jgi:hypothetical protein
MMMTSERDSLLLHVMLNLCVFAGAAQLKNLLSLNISSFTAKRTSDVLVTEETM